MRTNGFVAVGITHNKFVISIYLLSLIENVKMNAWIMFYVQTSIYEQVIKVLARQIYIYIYILFRCFKSYNINHVNLFKTHYLLRRTINIRIKY